MTRFNDGPARGHTLQLRRAPFFLRVVCEAGDLFGAGGKVDALDQISDEPTKDEKLFAYRLTATPGMVHIYRRQGGGGFYPMSVYVLVDPQPTDAEMRDKTRWAAWCEANKAMAGFLTKP